MKNIVYYLVLIIVLGSVLISFWGYQRYFKDEEPELLSFIVERGNIQEVIKARGEIAPQKDFDLEFPSPGIIEQIFVQEGQQVNDGDVLIGLETTSYGLEVKRLETTRIQSETNLDMLSTKAGSAKISLEDTRKNLGNELQDSYTKADDAVRNKADRIFTNPTNSPSFGAAIQGKHFSTSDYGIKTNLDTQRRKISDILSTWSESNATIEDASNIIGMALQAEQDMYFIRNFLNDLSSVVNAFPSGDATYNSIVVDLKSGIATARTNVNAAIANLTTAEEEYKTAESGLTLAEADIKIAEAQIEEAKSKIAITGEKIRKSTLYAPADAQVVKILFERGEFFSPGQTAIVLATPGHKIQADISELEIGRIGGVDGNEVLIQLDAFPGLELKGKVISIEPREIIKEGDKYYRTNIYVEPHGPEVRSGMNADLTIYTSSKEDVLKIPEFAVYRKDDKKIVTILEGDKQIEVEIETGISDGDSIEVINGLSEGQTIIVSVD